MSRSAGAGAGFAADGVCAMGAVGGGDSESSVSSGTVKMGRDAVPLALSIEVLAGASDSSLRPMSALNTFAHRPQRT